MSEQQLRGEDSARGRNFSLAKWHSDKVASSWELGWGLSPALGCQELLPAHTELLCQGCVPPAALQLPPQSAPGAG